MVTGRNIDKRGDPVAWVRPLVDIETWREVDPLDFPPRGSVFWPGAGEAVRDAFVFFRPKENTMRMPGKDELMLGDQHFAFEVLDLRWLGSVEKVRAGLISGLNLPSVPPVRSLIWCCDGVIIGPVGLVDGAGTTTLEKSNRHRIPCFNAKPGDIRKIAYEGLTRYVFSRTSLGSPDTFVDWDDDKHVVRRALEFAADIAKRSGSAVEMSKHLIDEAAEAVTSEGSTPELRWRLSQLERTRSLIESLNKNADLATEAINGIRAHPVILKALEEVKAAERKAARAETEAALQKERDEIARLGKERSAAESALNDVRRKIQEADEEAGRKAAETEERIRRSVEDAIRSVPDLLAQVAILKPFLGSGSLAQPVAADSVAVPRWGIGQTTISTVKEVRTRIVPLLKAASVPVPSYQRLHAALSVRLLPFVCGPRALDLLKAYARVATAGRITVINVTNSIVEASDAFGRVDASRARFIPHPCGLIDVVRAAKESTGYMLIALDGANRGATESYLLPLVSAALRRSGPLPLFHPCAVGPDDPYRECALIDWPENLLLAATLVEGPTTLPVAPDLWADGVLIRTDAGEAGPPPQLAQPPTGTSEIDPKSTLLKPAQSGDAAPFDALEGLIDSNAILEAGRRFERAFAAFQSDPSTVHAEVVQGVLVPFLASIADDDERAEALSQAKKTLGQTVASSLEGAVSIARRRIA